MFKTLPSLTFFILALGHCLAQQSGVKIYGTMQINIDTALDRTEVTLGEWIAFINDNNFDNSLFPDSNKISAPVKILFDDIRTNNGATYFKTDRDGYIRMHTYGIIKQVITTAKYNALVNEDTNYLSINNPITGISFAQAVLFCKWKEGLINKIRVRGEKIKVSLPPIEVYKEVITNIDSFCHGKCDSCSRFTFNYAGARCNKHVKDKRTERQGVGLIRADSYWPTRLGVYCIQGNAAEMTSTEGVAMGGSFRHTARQSYNDQIQKYNTPQDWLGFRYMVTYAERQ